MTKQPPDIIILDDPYDETQDTPEKREAFRKWFTEGPRSRLHQMTWYERREILLHMAVSQPGWECVRLPGERRRGRVIMDRGGYRRWKPGFYPVDHPEFEQMARHYQAKHKKATLELPK
jgi:hypothetical protein